MMALTIDFYANIRVYLIQIGMVQRQYISKKQGLIIGFIIFLLLIGSTVAGFNK